MEHDYGRGSSRRGKSRESSNGAERKRSSSKSAGHPQRAASSKRDRSHKRADSPERNRSHSRAGSPERDHSDGGERKISKRYEAERHKAIENAKAELIGWLMRTSLDKPRIQEKESFKELLNAINDMTDDTAVLLLEEPSKLGVCETKAKFKQTEVCKAYRRFTADLSYAERKWYNTTFAKVIMGASAALALWLSYYIATRKGKDGKSRSYYEMGKDRTMGLLSYVPGLGSWDPKKREKESEPSYEDMLADAAAETQNVHDVEPNTYWTNFRTKEEGKAAQGKDLFPDHADYAPGGKKSPAARAAAKAAKEAMLAEELARQPSVRKGSAPAGLA